jgi:transglutaminase superfamily protein
VRRKISKFLALSPGQRWLLVQTLFLLPLAAAALRLLSFRRVSTTLARLSPAVAEKAWDDDPETLSQVRTTARMVNLAARHGFFNASCLHRAMILWWLLRRQGIASDLRFGVRKEEGEVHAHAWVEYRGDPLDDEQNLRQHYVTFEQALIP